MHAKVPGAARVVEWLRARRPDRRTIRSDVLAGLTGAVGSVPDGMAAAALVGVNPVAGLYASAVGRVAGGLTTHTRLMVITTTSAAALAAGSVLAEVPQAERPGALVLLTIMAGTAMILASVLRLGRFTRFVAHSVMIGFLTGVGLNIVLSQVPNVLGVAAEGPTSVAKAIDALGHIADADLPSVLVSLGALLIVILLSRTPARAVSAVVTLGLPTAVVIGAGLDSVSRVSDSGPITAGLPTPHLPELRLLSPSLVTGALAIAAIVLVQGAGVAQSAPNDGSLPDPDKDFAAQGIAGVAVGLFQGIPVGGSVGQTALNVAGGARSRWGSITGGVWILLVLVLFSGLVEMVATPTLAAVLIYAALGSFRLGEVTTIWRTSSVSRIAMTSTFVATLALPVAAAVGVGVIVSLLLQLNREALDLVVLERVHEADGTTVERPAPRRLASHRVTELIVYGSLMYAGARTLQARLPDPRGSEKAVVVLRLRGRTSLGATFVTVVGEYAAQLGAAGGRLYLSGVDPDLLVRLERNGHVNGDAPVKAFVATEHVGEATARAVEAGSTWLLSRRPD